MLRRPARAQAVASKDLPSTERKVDWIRSHACHKPDERLVSDLSQFRGTRPFAEHDAPNVDVARSGNPYLLGRSANPAANLGYRE